MAATLTKNFVIVGIGELSHIPTSNPTLPGNSVGNGSSLVDDREIVPNSHGQKEEVIWAI